MPSKTSSPVSPTTAKILFKQLFCFLNFLYLLFFRCDFPPPKMIRMNYAFQFWKIIYDFYLVLLQVCRRRFHYGNPFPLIVIHIILGILSFSHVIPSTWRTEFQVWKRWIKIWILLKIRALIQTSFYQKKLVKSPSKKILQNNISLNYENICF